MLMASGPSQLFVSPPAMASPYRSARGNMPSYSATANSMPPCRGRARAMTPANGSAAMAARSLRLAARTLASHPPRIDLGQLEIDVIGQQVDRDDALVDAGHPSTAASSPGPSRNSG